jgi:hypothetical protein
MATSTLLDVYHAIGNTLVSNPELGEAHASYQKNEDGSATIHVDAMEGVTK